MGKEILSSGWRFSSNKVWDKEGLWSYQSRSKLIWSAIGFTQSNTVIFTDGRITLYYLGLVYV